ncbi:MAG: hypothetical protein HC910_08395 [Spirulinaceae cyanobacterium SM2_1_0]|nr:hypothetical protein [Spirulinaceae cyanobacterium SM2_1_0]
MTANSAMPPAFPNFDPWLERQILTLSVDALSRAALTCTACGEVRGEHIIEYQGESLRLPARSTYAFLHYVLAGMPAL